MTPIFLKNTPDSAKLKAWWIEISRSAGVTRQGIGQMHIGPDSEGLVKRAVEGDSVALKLLLTNSRPRLRGYVSSRIPQDLSRVVDADDLVQDALMDVFRYIGTFEERGPDSFFRWVATITLHKLRNAIRSCRAAKRGGGRVPVTLASKGLEDSTIALLDQLAGTGNTPSRSVARGEAVRAVHLALEGIPKSNRRAVWLVHIEGRSAKDAAADMGKTERAVHGLCRRGLVLLRGELQSASRFLSSTG